MVKVCEIQHEPRIWAHILGFIAQEYLDKIPLLISNYWVKAVRLVFKDHLLCLRWLIFKEEPNPLAPGWNWKLKYN